MYVNIMMNKKDKTFNVCRIKELSVLDLVRASSRWDIQEMVEYTPETIIKSFSFGLDELFINRNDYSIWTTKDISAAMTVMSAVCNLASNNKDATFFFEICGRKSKKTNK